MSNDLGLFNISRKLLVLSLPRKCNSIIVKYDNELKITCAIPPQKHTVIVKSGINTQNLAIKTPPILFSTNYESIPAFNQDIPIQGYFILGYSRKHKKRIYAAPYIISNVYHSGRICFGPFLKPKTPRHGYNMFWGSTFNSDLFGEIEGIGIENNYTTPYDLMKKYKKNVFSEQDWEDYTDDICGTKFWSSPEGAEGLLISTNKTLLSKIPEKHHRNFNGIKCIIARANPNPENQTWEFFGGNFTFSLPEQNVTITVKKPVKKKKRI